MSTYTPRFLAKVQNKEFVFASDYNRGRFREYLQTLDGKDVVIEVRKKTTQRSNKQNNYYWGAILPTICTYTGGTAEEADRDLRGMFLKQESYMKMIDLETGEVLKESKISIPSIPSSKELTTGEFSEYLMKIESWAIPFFEIEHWPDPEEYELRHLTV